MLLDRSLCSHHETPDRPHDQVQVHPFQLRQTGKSFLLIAVLSCKLIPFFVYSMSSTHACYILQLSFDSYSNLAALISVSVFLVIIVGLCGRNMVDGAAAAHVRIDLTNLLTISHFFVFAKKKKKTVKNIILDYFYKEELEAG